MRDSAHCGNLMSIDLSKNEIVFGPEHMEALSGVLREKNSTLERIKLSHNQLGDEMLTAMMPSVTQSCLTHIYMNDCRLTIRGLAAFFQYLRGNYSVSFVSLKNNDFSMPDLSNINSSLTFKEVKDVDHYISEFLSSNHCLKELHLDNSTLYDRVCRAIGRGLNINQYLTVLSVSHNLLTDECIEGLFQGIIGS
jgi:hypothetical protein